jgi:predicted HAD superfamily Cof-like phosphohydrolase
MTNPFRDQEKFMKACDQSVDKQNDSQYNMYCTLIEEETKEFFEAVAIKDKKEQLKELMDIIVVTVGAIHSMGADAEGAWKEVMRSNFAKVDKETGKVRKREDGKVLKPLGWTAPDITPYLEK